MLDHTDIDVVDSNILLNQHENEVVHDPLESSTRLLG